MGYKIYNELAWRGNQYYQSIQEAINAASPGETINVDGKVTQERIYEENVSNNKDLNVHGDSKLYFDGVNDVLVIDNDALNFQDSFSISAWIIFKSITIGKNEYLVCGGGTDGPSGGKYHIVLPGSNNKMQSSIQTPGSWGGPIVYALNDSIVNVPYNVISVWDKPDNTWKFYINGVLQGTASTVGLTALNNNGKLNIGALAPSYYWSNTNIWDVRAYGRALTQQEVSDLYNGIIINDENLVGWWTLNEGSNSLIKDRSKSEISVSVVGSPTWVSDEPTKVKSYFWKRAEQLLPDFPTFPTEPTYSGANHYVKQIPAEPTPYTYEGDTFIVSDQVVLPDFPTFPAEPTYEGNTLTVKQIPAEPTPYTYGGTTHTVHATSGTANYTNMADVMTALGNGTIVNGDTIDVQDAQTYGGTLTTTKSIKIIGIGSIASTDNNYALTINGGTVTIDGINISGYRSISIGASGTCIIDYAYCVATDYTPINNVGKCVINDGYFTGKVASYITTGVTAQGFLNGGTFVKEIQTLQGSTVVDGITFSGNAKFTSRNAADIFYILDYTTAGTTTIAQSSSLFYIYNGIDTSGWTITGTGTVYYPCYETIQSAINASSAGDILQVMDGTYTENLTINKNISIMSDDANLIGYAEIYSSCMLNINVDANDGREQSIRIGANNIDVFLKDMIVTGATRYGVYVVGSADVVLNNVILHSNSWIGYDIRSDITVNSYIQNCEIYGNGLSGLSIKTGTNFVTVLYNNNFHDNGPDSGYLTEINSEKGTLYIKDNIINASIRNGLRLLNPVTYDYGNTYSGADAGYYDLLLGTSAVYNTDSITIPKVSATSTSSIVANTITAGTITMSGTSKLTTNYLEATTLNSVVGTFIDTNEYVGPTSGILGTFFEKMSVLKNTGNLTLNNFKLYDCNYGITNFGNIEINNCIIDENVISGIYNEATADVIDSTIENNTTGVTAVGETELTNCAINDNDVGVHTKTNGIIFNGNTIKSNTTDLLIDGCEFDLEGRALEIQDVLVGPRGKTVVTNGGRIVAGNNDESTIVSNVHATATGEFRPKPGKILRLCGDIGADTGNFNKGIINMGLYNMFDSMLEFQVYPDTTSKKAIVIYNKEDISNGVLTDVQFWSQDLTTKYNHLVLHNDGNTISVIVETDSTATLNLMMLFKSGRKVRIMGA